jgi:hypothetical protein
MVTADDLYGRIVSENPIIEQHDLFALLMQQACREAVAHGDALPFEDLNGLAWIIFGVYEAKIRGLALGVWPGGDATVTINYADRSFVLDPGFLAAWQSVQS